MAVELRPWRDGDGDAVDALVAAAWPGDPAMRALAGQHGPPVERPSLRRRTVVAEVGGGVVGAASVTTSERHPTWAEVALTVAPPWRRRGVGTVLVGWAAAAAGGRPLMARTRAADAGGLAFGARNGFRPVMRSRTGTVDPTDPAAVAWAARHRRSLPDGVTVDEGGEADDDVVAAFAALYAALHGWNPPTERPLEESSRICCGPTAVPGSLLVARAGGRIVGVADVLDLPWASPPGGAGGWYLVWFGAVDPDAPGAGALTRHLVALVLDRARAAGRRFDVEVDDAHRHGAAAMNELPVRWGPDLLAVAQPAGAD